jgi:hypothetical protein
MSNKENELEDVEATTQEEIGTDPRTLKIQTAIKDLISLCQEEPQASIICSVGIPATEGEEKDLFMQVYVGDTVSQIMQLDHLTKTNLQFLNDLKTFLELRIKRQIAEHGTTENELTDKILANMDKNQRMN